jgi:hypothetical protein
MAYRDPILMVDKNSQSGIFIKWYRSTDQREADDKHDMEATVQASDGS